MGLLKEKVYCSECNQKTNHLIIESYEEFSDPNVGFQRYTNYHIVQCAGCNNTAFVKHWIDEDYSEEYLNNQLEWTGTQQIYEIECTDIYEVYPQEPPKESFEKWLEETLNLEKKHFPHMPEILYDLYKQIIDSYNMRHNVLCASGLRTLIEGVCKELEVKKGHVYKEDGTIEIEEKTGKEMYNSTLPARIFGLYEKGYIIFPQALILNKIKEMGNKAVHSIVSPDTMDLREVIQVMEQILYVIYELKAHKLLEKKEEEQKEETQEEIQK